MVSGLLDVLICFGIRTLKIWTLEIWTLWNLDTEFVSISRVRIPRLSRYLESGYRVCLDIPSPDTEFVSISRYPESRYRVVSISGGQIPSLSPYPEARYRVCLDKSSPDTEFVSIFWVQIPRYHCTVVPHIVLMPLSDTAKPCINYRITVLSIIGLPCFQLLDYQLPD